MNLRGWKIVVLALPLLAFGCGKSAQFQKQDYSAVAIAGQYTKPKIDILVFQDNSASMVSPMASIKPQLDSFLNNLGSSWDFRFTVLPLQATMSANGKYIVAADCSTVTVGTCLTPSQASYFNGVGSDYGWITSYDYNIGSTDLGFQKMQSNIGQTSVSGAGGFLRSDAALAVIVISNGEDVTNVNYWDPDGDGTSEIYYQGSNSVNSLNTFTSYLSTVKGGSGLLKFYPVVATSTSPGSTTCYGSSAFVGWRYMQAATALGGFSYNLCSGGVSSVFSSIDAQINSLIASIVFNYAVINEAPIVSSIVVKKNGVVIPQSSSNGWSYEGYKADSYTSYMPQLGNKKTGYFIRLNGTATYKGTDMITVDYQKQ